MRSTLWGTFADPVNTRRAPGGVRGEARRPGPAGADGRRGRGATPLPSSGPGLSGAGASARSMPRPDTCAPNAGFAPRRAAQSRRRAPCGAQAPGRDRPARRPAAVVALVAVAALFALAAPAQAQTEPVWSTTMTVGETSKGGRGYYVDESDGALDIRSFRVGGTDHPVRALIAGEFGPTDSDDGGLAFWVDGALSSYADYTLEFAGETLPLAEATPNSSGNVVEFSPAWLTTNAPSLSAAQFETTLAIGDQVQVCLRTATQVCPPRTDPVWSATMTVGETTPDTVGFNREGFYSGGSLDPESFTTAGSTYRVEQLDVGLYEDGLLFKTNPKLSSSDSYTLEFAGETLPLSDFSNQTSGIFDFTWLAANAPSLSETQFETTLAVDNEVPVCLRTASQVCPGGTTIIPTSSDATLSGLALADSDGNTISLGETFVPATTTYTASVANGIDTVTLTATPTHTGASVSAVTLGGSAIADTVFTDGITVPSLAEGANVIVVTVMAEDGSTAPYTVTVTRAAATTTCLAPTLAGRTQIWTGTVTVAEIIRFGSTVVAHGFDATGEGALDNTTFDVEPNSYVIDTATKYPDDGNLRFGLTSALSTTDRAQLTLHVCDDSFAFSAATLLDQSSSYEWSTSIDDWSSETTRTLYLSVPSDDTTTTTPPAIVTDGVQVTSTPTTGDTYGLGETIEITVTFDTAVTVDTSGGTPRIQFRLGPPRTDKWAEYSSGSGGTALVFTYTVQSGDMDDDGIWLPADYLELQSGTIRDAADNTVDATLTYLEPGLQTGHKVNGSPATTEPGAPTSLTATASGTTTIDLSWTAPGDNGGSAITGYRIEVSPNGTSSWTNRVADTGTTATTYSHTGLDAGTTRHYRVSAINSVGTGAASSTDNATTDDAAPTEPGAPTSLTATASGTTAINLSWTAPADDGGSDITGYRIEVSPNGTSSWNDLVANTGSTTTYSHTGLDAGDTRHYRVSAINSVGTGAASNVDNATTDAAAPTEPGAPTSLTATASGTTTIDLSWTAPGDNGGSAITGYRIEVSPNGTSSWTNRVADTGTTATTYSHTGLSAGSTRHYRVSAINSVGTGAASNVDDATTDATTVPGAPTSLSATASGTTTIDLSWTAPGDNGGSAITGYRIEVSPNGSSGWSNRVANTGTTATTYSHTGLSAGTTRHYRVSAINSVGTGAASNVDDATTDAAATTVPGAPTSLSATASGTTTIDLSWTVPADNGGSAITGYRIEVSPNGTSSWTNRVADTGTTATTYSHTGLSAGSTRHYRVSAINSVGTGAASNVDDATTDAAATTVPGAPTGLTATASGTTTIDLSWTAPGDNGGSAITGYRIEVSPNGTSSWTNRVADTGTTATTYSHTGLDAGTTRHYRVSAINSVGTGAASNVDDATTDAAATTVPGAPTGLTATASGSTRIDLSWTAPGDNGGSAITGYRIEVSPNGTSSWTNRVADTGTTATTYSHTGLSAGTTRHYRVSAINSVGTGAASSTDNATTDDAATTVPGAPTSLTATASGTTTIDLSWTAPSDNGGSAITGYRIEVSPNGSFGWSNRVANTGTTTASYSHTSLSAGTTRYYRVSAINTNGTGNRSNTANATTATTVPGAPTSLTATASGTTTIDLSWNAPSDNGGSSITGYRIEVSPNGSSGWSNRVADTGTTATTYSHTGLDAGTTRHYRVSAINSVGTGAASNVDDATTTNTAATGMPTISGTAQVGKILMALTSGISDADGLPASFTYQWVRVDSDGTSTETGVGSNSNTYSPTAADVGKKIRVKVSFTDNAGNSEGPLTSDAYPASGTIAPASITPPPGTDVLVRNTGEALLLGGTSSIGAQSFVTGFNAGGYAVSAVQIRLKSVSGKTTVVKIREDNNGEPGDLVATLTNPASLSAHNINTFTAPPGTTLAASTTYWITKGEGISDSSRLTLAFTAATAETGEPGWSIGDSRLYRTSETLPWFTSTQSSLMIAIKGTAIGAASDDATLGALTVNDGTSDLTLAPAFAPGTFAYAAEVGNAVTTVTLTAMTTDDGASVNAVTLGGIAIADTDFTDGITVPSLLVDDNDIVVTVTAENGDTRTYTLTVTRQTAVNNPATGAPAISGTAQVGQTLTAATTDIADADGLANPSYDYQWVRVDGSSETDITGATSSTYMPVAADVGKKLKVKVSFTDDASNNEELTSDAYPESRTVEAASTTAPTTVTISADKTSAVFKEDDITYTVTRTGSTTAALPVTVLLTQTADFLAATELTKTVTIGADQSTATFTVAASSFQHFAAGTKVGGGTLTATVQDGSAYNPGTTNSVEVDIVIGVMIGFEMAAYSVDEAISLFQVKVIAHTGPGAGQPTSEATYSILPADDSATNPRDFFFVDIPAIFLVNNFLESGAVWQAEHNYVVQITNDQEVEDDETFDLRIEQRDPSTATYSLVDASGNSCGSVCTATVTIIDDDTPGVTVSPTALTVMEEDATGDSYTVVLDTEPTANVTVTVAGHSGTDVTPTPVSLTFTASNWDAAQTVTVTAGNDADPVNDEVTLTHSAASTDSGYSSGITIPSVAVTVRDNDTAVAASICGRTDKVRDELLRLIENNVGAAVACADVTTTHLAAITGALDLSGQNIAELTAGDFAGLTGLTELSLYNNKLRSLPGGVFDELGALDILVLARNGLTTLDEDVFDALDKLTELNLQENDLTGLPAGVFDRLRALDILTLDENGLITLPAGVFDRLTELEVLWLDGNDLTELPAGIFNELGALEVLTLRRNSLVRLPDGVFEPLTALKDLWLRGNPGVPFAPGAVALPDDGTVPVAGGAVRLDGRDSGGAWGTNVTYGWALTTPTSGATFNNDTSPTPEVTIEALPANTELTFTLTVTGRGGTDGIDPATDTATVTVTRAASAGVSVTPTALTVTEEDPAGAGYTVVLDTLPMADVTVTVAGHAGTAVTPAPVSLTFTPSDWDTAQTVTVTAGDDADMENDTVPLTHGAESTDGNYNGVGIADVAVTVTDNDLVQVTGVVVEPGNARLAVSWTAVANATGYKVQWKSGSENYNTTDRQATIASGSTTSHTITGLVNATRYTVRVIATWTGASDGPPSAEAMGRPRGESGGICGRTPAVRDALLVLIEENEGAIDCADVSAAHLAAITGRLDLSGQGIEALKAGDFAGLTGLKQLYLYGNALSSLPGRVFADLSALDNLDLNNNDLSSLPGGVFAGLTELTNLALFNNELTTLSGGVFAGLGSLRALSLDGNGLTALSGGVFDGLTELGYLNLDHNELTTLPGGVFEPLTALTDLQLVDNDGAPFSPEAVALPDDGTVPVAGGMVTLDGSGSGGAWGANVTYDWALTTPVSGVTFDDNTSATPVVTIPALAADVELTFTLTVTGGGGAKKKGVVTGADTATVTVTPAARSARAAAIPEHDEPESPPLVSVADVKVREGPGAVLAFNVMLDRASRETATVDWETLDGSAKAGEDYVAASGTLAFGPGETVKTVRVAVIDDAHDEGHEVMLLMLPNAQGAVIGDAVAKGTIENSDRMPTAWLARFGRAASDHVVEAVGDRWQGGPQASHLTIGGRQAGQLFGWSGLGGQAGRDTTVDRDEPVGTDPSSIGLFAPSGGAGAGLGGGLGGQAGRDTTVDRDEPVGTDPSSTGLFAPSGGAGAGLGGTAPGMGVSGMNAMPGGPGGVDREAGRTLSGRAAQGALLRAVGLPDPRALPDLRTVLMGSSFFYSAALDDDGRTRSAGRLGEWSAWGRTAATRFQGNDEGMALDGEVATAMLGFDSRWDRWLAGVVFSYSEGQGAYTHPTASGGAVASTMTGLHPYARFELNERTSVWGVLGYGAGELSLTPERSETALGTDLTNAMAAFGGRTALSVRTGRAGRFELAVRSDARLTSTASDAIEGLVGAAGQTGRVRLMLEGSGSMPLATGGVLKPKLEAGLRYDAGDAETGAGLEVGGGLGYAAGRLSVQVDARGLLAHQDTEYEEWGFSGSIAYTPSEDGRGLSMRLGSAWGATQSGVQSLWSRQDASGLARNAAFDTAQRYQVELRYGLDGRKGRARWMPFIGVESADGSSRALRLGVALTSGLRLDAGLELGLRQGLPGADLEYAVQLRGALRW